MILSVVHAAHVMPCYDLVITFLALLWRGTLVECPLTVARTVRHACAHSRACSIGLLTVWACTGSTGCQGEGRTMHMVRDVGTPAICDSDD